jgi:hypothetical protein
VLFLPLSCATKTSLTTTLLRVARWADILLEARFAAELKLDRRGKAVGLWADVKADMREWAELFEPGVRKRTGVGVGVCLLQQMSGINALL